MSLRRATVAVSLLVTAGLGAGVATSANAYPPCDQAAQVCHTYDTDARTAAAFLFATYAACAQNVPSGAVCTAVQTAGGLAYLWVFTGGPWVCWYNEPVIGTGCVGPIE